MKSHNCQQKNNSWVHIQRAQVIACLCLCAFAFAQKSAEHDVILGKLASYAMKNSPEKVYVHTDKNLYTNGETIWFKAYLLDGILHQASEKSEVLYVELWNGADSVLVRQKLQVKGIGAHGSIDLPVNSAEGNYILRAYTRYMLNERNPTLFQKVIPVYNQEFGDYKGFRAEKEKGLPHSERVSKKAMKARPIQVLFFPEGGDLVGGLTSVLGVKATDSQGGGVALEGTIQDPNKKTVAFFKTYDSGLGKVTFTPVENTVYKAETTYNGDTFHFPVPEVKSKGYVLGIRNNGDHLVVQVNSTGDNGLDGTFLVGHFRGDVFLEKIGTELDGNMYSLRLSTERLLNGVAHFTLFTASGEPVAERLVFIDHPNGKVDVGITMDKTEFEKRELTSMELSALDKKGTMLKGDFSVSVYTADNVLPAKLPYVNIKSWLLLNSDLGNSVNDAAYFFEEDSRERKYLLDALMLTHGWRRFVWKEVLENGTKAKKYLPEKVSGTTLRGFAASSKNPDIRKYAKVRLRIPSLNILDEQLTDSRGNFSFGPFNLKDGDETYLEVVDNGKVQNRQNDNIRIYLDEDWPSPPTRETRGFPTNEAKGNTEIETDQKIREYLGKTYRQKSADFEIDPTITQLEEVAVSAPKKNRIQEIESTMLHSSPTIRISPEEFNANDWTAIELIGRAPGVVLKGVRPNQYVEIRGLRGYEPGKKLYPLYFVNEAEVDLGYVQNMDASEVLFLDVLRGIEAAVYGLRGAGGVVVITTKRVLSKGNSGEEGAQMAKTLLPTLNKTREFFIPNYGFERPEYERLDYRTTLLWQPNYSIEDSTTMPIRFYTGDLTGKFLVHVEGITKDGRTVVGEKILEVK